MGNVDISQMKFMRDAGHFADFWNGPVFSGRQVVKQEELMEISPVGLAVTKNRKTKRTADMVMGRMKDGGILGIMICENQLEVDYGMVIRVHLREMMEYDRQMERIAKRNKAAIRKHVDGYEKKGEYLYGIKKNDRLRPVSTLVLYWNNDAWDGARTLHEMLDFSGFEEMRGLVSDVRMNLVDIGSITGEEKLFKDKEVRDVIGLFLRRNDKEGFRDYLDKHGSEVYGEAMDVLAVLVSSEKLKNLIAKSSDGKGDGQNMCQAINELIKDGEDKGRREGLAEGLAEGKVVGLAEGLAEGKVVGLAEATEVINNLNAVLISEKRYDDLSRSTGDKKFQYELVKKYFPEKAALFA